MINYIYRWDVANADENSYNNSIIERNHISYLYSTRSAFSYKANHSHL